MAPKTAKPVMVRFGSIISEKRKLLKMSQEELAERVGISQESIADLFRGEDEAGEWAHTIERLLLPLPRQAQEEIVGIVAAVARLTAPR